MRPPPEYAFPRRDIRRCKLLRRVRLRFQGWSEMTPIRREFAFLSLGLPFLLACSFVEGSQAQAVNEIGGQKIVTVARKVTSTTKPEFTSITLAPGRGMELIQITANFPGKGNIDVLASPDLAAAKKMLDQDDNANGDLAYRLGSVFLVPYPNRLRGKDSHAVHSLTTQRQ